MNSLFGSGENMGHKNFTEEFPMTTRESAQNEKTITTSKLSNGITLVSETPSLPRDVTISLLLNVGSRDETPRNSGALHSLLTTYYKSFANTNETINYGMVQMSGGRFAMNYNREQALFKMSCLSHDVVDIFSMMADCALEPRNFNSVGVAQSKLGNSHNYRKVAGIHNDFTDVVFRSVWGDRGLGMPVWGNPGNIGNLDSSTMQTFQLENVCPNKMVVCGLGVENHGEFHELVEQKLGNLYYNNNGVERQQSVFQENDVRLPTNSGASQFAILFEAPNMNSTDVLQYYLLSEILGNVEVNQFDPLEMKNSRFNDLYKTNSYFNALEARNYHFSDAGMFLLRGVVSGDNLNSGVESVAQVFKNLQNTTQADYERARKRLGLRLMENLENDYMRAEEFAKQQSVWGQVKGDNLLAELNSLTLKEFKNVVGKLGKAKLSTVVESPNLNNIHSYEKIQALFK